MKDADFLELQAAYARESTPFWSALADQRGFLLTKEHLRKSSSAEFVPLGSVSSMSRCFATSGTTGAPTYSYWTQDDWDFKIRTIVRALRNGFVLPERIVALNCYSLNHLAGSIFDGVIRALGGVSIGVGYFVKDADELARLYRQLGCNTLIVGDSEDSYKFSVGAKRALGSLRAQGAPLSWWLSSGPLSAEARDLAEVSRVGASTSFYGCSEFGFLALGCPLDLSRYHLLGGDTRVERLSSEHASKDARFKIVVSRVGRRAEKNPLEFIPHRGSQYIGYLNGDEAAWETDPCACGIRSDRLHSIRRE